MTHFDYAEPGDRVAITVRAESMDPLDDWEVELELRGPLRQEDIDRIQGTAADAAYDEAMMAAVRGRLILPDDARLVLVETEQPAPWPDASLLVRLAYRVTRNQA
jgi:hypothetical protein